MLQWADVTGIGDSQATVDLNSLQHGRKLAVKAESVRLGPDVLLVQRQVGQGAFASVYKVVST